MNKLILSLTATNEDDLIHELAEQTPIDFDILHEKRFKMSKRKEVEPCKPATK